MSSLVDQRITDGNVPKTAADTRPADNQHQLNVNSDGHELFWWAPSLRGQGSCDRRGWGHYDGIRHLDADTQVGTYRLVLTKTEATLTLMNSEGNVATTWNGNGTSSGLTGTWTGSWDGGSD